VLGHGSWHRFHYFGKFQSIVAIMSLWISVGLRWRAAKAAELFEGSGCLPALLDPAPYTTRHCLFVNDHNKPCSTEFFCRCALYIWFGFVVCGSTALPHGNAPSNPQTVSDARSDAVPHPLLRVGGLLPCSPWSRPIQIPLQMGSAKSVWVLSIRNSVCVPTWMCSRTSTDVFMNSPHTGPHSFFRLYMSNVPYVPCAPRHTHSKSSFHTFI